MRVSHYLEFEHHVIGGIRESVRHQRTMLDRAGIVYLTKPRLDVDILHLNLLGPRSLWVARRAHRRDVPVVAHTHVTPADFRQSFRYSNVLARGLRPYLAHAYRSADMLVSPTAHAADRVERLVGSRPRVISNGVDPEKLAGGAHLAARYRERFDLTPPVVFTVGHVLLRKGLDTFVALARRHPDLDFAWFGPLHRRLKGRRTREVLENAPPNCTFTGFVPDIRGAYAAGDIFCFPTREENEGIALLEAMATGTPVVVRDIPPFTWLEDGSACLKADSLAAFARAVDRLRDGDLRDRLGTAAAERSSAFHLDTLAPRYTSLYEEVAV